MAKTVKLFRKVSNNLGITKVFRTFAETYHLYIMKINLKLLLVLAILCVVPFSARANWNSFVDNYNNTDYGRGTTTWRISTAGRWTFFANQNGILVYNGAFWQHFYLNNRSETRSVAVMKDKGRVYVGGENEFGYLEPKKTGELKYHCLSDRLGKEYSSIGNVFDIYEADGVIYYRCDNYVLIANGGKYRLVKSPGKIFSSVMVDMMLYVATDNGVYMLAGSKLVPIKEGQILYGKRINSMIKYGKGFLITTFSDGLFYCDGSTVVPFHTSADDLLRQGGICCAALNGNLLAFGTIHNGLVLVDLKQGNIRTYGEINGLQHNTVLSLAFDDMGNVWAGLDCGIDYINLKSPFSYLYKTPYSYGIGNASVLKDNYLYLATDRGMYYVNYPVVFNHGRADVRQLPIPSGAAWNLYRYGDEVLCLHDKGIYSIRGTQVERVTHIIGAWSCGKVIGHPDMLFVGVYDGLYLIRKVGTTWTTVARLKGITTSGRYFRQVDASTLKVYDVKLGTATVYKLAPSLTSLTKVKTINEAFPVKWDNYQHVSLENLELGGNANVINGLQSIIPCNMGFLMYDKNATATKKLNVFINRIVTTTNKDSVVYMDDFTKSQPVVSIPYSLNSVRIEYGITARMMIPSVKYRYRLNGGAWSETQKVCSKEYSDLFEGTYSFEVEAISPNGETATHVIEFRILPPWYRSVWAYLFYFIVFISVASWLWAFENRRIERKKRLVAMEKDKQMDQMKIEIDKLEKEKMDLDLKHKSQEIADLIISVKRKNEILTDIKQNLVVALNQLKGKNIKMGCQQLVLINSKIDTNIEGDEILKKFEEQFDVVNNQFMSKLSAQYPSLNLNERLMCAYLRMNLSTKEMAPLLNISVRGVETMRYRLRKKMSLEREDNLLDFLNKL